MVKEGKTSSSESNHAMCSVTFCGLPELERVDDLRVFCFPAGYSRRFIVRVNGVYD